MAEETPMTPVEAVEPPKANPLVKPAAPVAGGTVKLAPVIRKPATGATQTALRPGLKLPPKPGATQTALRPGLKLPPKPGATVTALRPGLKLPTKPVIHKPGEGAATHAPLPKPIVGAPTVAPAAKPAAAEAAAPKPVAVDAQGVGKLPTVEAKAIDRAAVSAAPDLSKNPSPMAALKSVTQKLKGITQQIPAQAILKKTGIIDDGAMSESQKEAAKHKTARISLSDAMGVAPVKNENAPMKTIRIKRPADIGGATKPLTPQPAPAAAAPVAEAAAPADDTSVTQRKTLKITRPTGGVRPGGKFGIKRPATATSATTVTAQPGAAPAAEPVGDIPDIANIPDMPTAPAPAAKADDGPAWLYLLSTVVQLAACVAIGALAYLLFENTQQPPF